VEVRAKEVYDVAHDVANRAPVLANRDPLKVRKEVGVQWRKAGELLTAFSAHDWPEARDAPAPSTTTVPARSRGGRFAFRFFSILRREGNSTCGDRYGHRATRLAGS
jgi:hypothetical protein